MKEKFTVIGIDPAPKKGLQTFNGKDDQIYIPNKACKYLENIDKNSNVLVCWDAPLTGPPIAVVDGGPATASSYTRRLIEKFFNFGDYNNHPGISVMGYSGCSHWTITRSLLGLPRVGHYDFRYDDLPFKLVTNNERPNSGCHVVEVHPALAIWLWCRGEEEANDSWDYKKSGVPIEKRRGLIKKIWRVLCSKNEIKPLKEFIELREPKTDDELDARVAYLLGRLWMDETDPVSLLGNANTGAFLLPVIPGLAENFEKFVKG